MPLGGTQESTCRPGDLGLTPTHPTFLEQARVHNPPLAGSTASSPAHLRLVLANWA